MDETTRSLGHLSEALRAMTHSVLVLHEGFDLIATQRHDGNSVISRYYEADDRDVVLDGHDALSSLPTQPMTEMQLSTHSLNDDDHHSSREDNSVDVDIGDIGVDVTSTLGLNTTTHVTMEKTNTIIERDMKDDSEP